MGLTFQLSSQNSAIHIRDLRRLAAGLAIASMEVALAWDLAPPKITAIDTGMSVDRRVVQISIKQSADAGIAGYHTINSDGVPYSHIFVTKTTTVNEWQRAVSHEVFETLVDPRCNAWAHDWNEHMWALEICDPVQTDWYNLSLNDGGPPIAISNWCTPAWFSDPVTVKPKLDRMGLLKNPWTVRPGGYAVVFADGHTKSVTNSPIKHPMSRWSQRMMYGKNNAQ